MHITSAVRIVIAATAMVVCTSVHAALVRFDGSDPLIRDSVTIFSSAIAHSRPAATEVMIFQDEPLALIEVTVAITGGKAVFDSASFKGSIYAPGSGKWLRLSSTKLTAFVVPPIGDLVPPGAGLFCKLYLSYPLNLPPQTISLDTTTYTYNLIEHTTSFTDSNLVTFLPVVRSGTIDILSTCCEGTRGNIDGSPDERVDISDLSTLIAHLFLLTAPLLPCPDEADLDVPADFAIDISDLSQLIDYLYIHPGDSPLPYCPSYIR